MAMSVRDLKEWLDGLPSDAEVGVDEDGLCLRVVKPPEDDRFEEQAYCEVGGLPEDEED